MASLLSSMGGSVTDMFERAKSSFQMPGIGVSAMSRAYGRDFMNKTSGDGSKIFSAGIENAYTLEGMQKTILAMRSRFSEENLAPGLRPMDIEESESSNASDGITASANGSVVDETA